MAFFSNQKIQFGQSLVGLAMEDVGIFCDQRSYLRPFGICMYFVAIRYILWLFGILYLENSGIPGLAG
jgi:hypothetical protein